MIQGVLTGNRIPHDKYDVRGIAHARTNRKDDIFLQRRLYIDDDVKFYHYVHLCLQFCLGWN